MDFYCWIIKLQKKLSSDVIFVDLAELFGEFLRTCLVIYGISFPFSIFKWLENWGSLNWEVFGSYKLIAILKLTTSIWEPRDLGLFPKDLLKQNFLPEEFASNSRISKSRQKCINNALHHFPIFHKISKSRH